MKKITLLNCLVCLLLLFPMMGHAQVNNQINDTQLYNMELPKDYDGEVRDSFYYMKDDGEFSDDEKDDEAMYIFQQCNSNFVQRIYYDCACVAGVFRQARDAEKLIPQGQIVSNIYTNTNTPCANTIGIAGDSYSKCTSYTKTYRGHEGPEKNQKYCQCVANDFAKEFSKTPNLNLRFIERLQAKSMVNCEKQT